jgi:SAM-dependent methyltransferase
VSSFKRGLSMILHMDEWSPQVQAVADRYNKEYRGEAFDLPDEVQAMPIFHEWMSKKLAAKVASPFWDLVKPAKNQRCLDLGCGIGFLIYPWREWEALFYGQEVSLFACETLRSRAPQLNSKLFKSMVQNPAHHLQYEDSFFDVAIATGFSCYYPLEYWGLVLEQVKRVLKGDGVFVFDILNPKSEIAENWAILETYLGAEAFLEPIEAWEELIKAAGGKVEAKKEGDLFCLYKVMF